MLLKCDSADQIRIGSDHRLTLQANSSQGPEVPRSVRSAEARPYSHSFFRSISGARAAKRERADRVRSAAATGVAGSVRSSREPATPALDAR